MIGEWEPPEERIEHAPRPRRRDHDERAPSLTRAPGRRPSRQRSREAVRQPRRAQRHQRGGPALGADRGRGDPRGRDRRRSACSSASRSSSSPDEQAKLRSSASTAPSSRASRSGSSTRRTSPASSTRPSSAGPAGSSRAGAARCGARARLPGLGAAQPGPRRGHLSGRPLRAQRLRESGTTPGTAATTCSATASCSRRWRRCSASAWSGPSRSSPRGDLCRARPPALRRRGASCRLWFGAGIARGCSPGGSPSSLGVAFGLGALLAADARRPTAAIALAALDRPREPGRGSVRRARRRAIALAGQRRDGALAGDRGGGPIASSSTSPSRSAAASRFAFSTFFAIPLLALAVLWLVPERYRALRIGACSTRRWPWPCSLVPNSARRQRHPPRRAGRRPRAGAGALAAGPAAGARRSRFRCSTGSWSPRSATCGKAAGDPATERAFYEPLLAELDLLAGRRSRIQIPPTENRWEAAYVAPASRSRAAGCASSSPTTSTSSRTATSPPPPTATGSTSTRSPTSRSPTPSSTISPMTRSR